MLQEYIRTRQKLFDREDVQPQSKKVFANGPIKNIHYLESGSGKPLIMIHGGNGHSSHWFNIIKPLSEHFHLYIIDCPGCGLSDTFIYNQNTYKKDVTNFIHSFMEALAIKQSMFMSNSMGAHFNILYALQYPEKVEKLLLIGAPAGLTLTVPLAVSLTSIKGLNKLMSSTFLKPSLTNTFLLHKYLLVNDATKLTYEYLQHDYYSQLISGSRKAFLTLMESVLSFGKFKRTFYLGDRMKELKMPVKFIWGTNDAFSNPKHNQQFLTSMLDYSFHMVENAGHMPWLDEPIICSDLIIKLLK